MERTKYSFTFKRICLALSHLKYLPVIFLFIPFISNGQAAFNNNGAAVYIQQTALLEVQGDLANNVSDSASSIYNDGTIELLGNFSNTSGAKFGVGANSNSTERVVKFIGSGKQYISGSMSTAGTASFYNLLVDQTAPSDTVEMETGVVTQGSVIFGSANTTTTYNPNSIYTNNNQKGFLKTYDTSLNEYLLDIQNGYADAIAGYPALEIGGTPTSGFILTSGIKGSSYGGLQRAVSSATSYVFPVGTANKGFNGVRLNFVQVPGGSVKAKFCDGSSNPTGYAGQISNYCSGCTGDATTTVGYNRFFESNECNNGAPQWVIFSNTALNHGYWSFASTNTGYVYDMEVFPNSYSGVIYPSSTWRVLKHEAAYGVDPSDPSTDWRPEVESLISSINDLTTYTKNAGCYTGTGVPGGLYTDFSQFTMGSSNSDNSLPVKLLYIQAVPEGKHTIQVQWATAIEVNNAGFEVQRSTDAVNFTDLAWVAGHDNSTVNEDYAYNDRVPQLNVPYYYRLKQIDNNQNFTYSNIAQATLQGSGGQSGFALYPNPTSNELTLVVNNPANEINIRVYDMQGRQMYENIFTVEQPGESQTVTFNASASMPPGTYIVSAATNGQSYKDKFILQ